MLFYNIEDSNVLHWVLDVEYLTMKKRKMFIELNLIENFLLVSFGQRLLVIMASIIKVRLESFWLGLIRLSLISFTCITSIIIM